MSDTKPINHAEAIEELVKAAEKVHTRWETPTWKDAEPTAIVMNKLRDALESLNRSKS